MTKTLTLLAGACLASGSLLAQIAPPPWLAAPGRQQPINDGQQFPVSGKPFSGTEIRSSVQTLADGTRVEKSDTGLYHRDDKGRARSEGKTIAMIFDPVGGFRYDLNMAMKTYTRIPINSNTTYSFGVVGNGTFYNSSTTNTNDKAGQGTAGVRPSADTKPVTEELPSQTINGVFARGSRVTTTFPKGTFGNDREVKLVSERWSSDDLRVLVKSTTSDPRFGVNSYELTNVVRAPPDPALFQVPAGFTEKASMHPIRHD